MAGDDQQLRSTKGVKPLSQNVQQPKLNLSFTRERGDEEEDDKQKRLAKKRTHAEAVLELENDDDKNIENHQAKRRAVVGEEKAGIENYESGSEVEYVSKV